MPLYAFIHIKNECCIIFQRVLILFYCLFLPFSIVLSATNPYYVDDWAVITLIQGSCFKGLKRYDEATQCFQAIIDR